MYSPRRVAPARSVPTARKEHTIRATRLITAATAALALAGIGAAGAVADGTTVIGADGSEITITDKSVEVKSQSDLNFTGDSANPCTGEPAIATQTFHLEQQQISFIDGLRKVRAKGQGTLTLVPLDPTKPTYTGSFSADSRLEQSVNLDFTVDGKARQVQDVDLRGTDGSRIRIRVNVRLVATGPDEFTPVLDRTSLSCLV